MRRKFFGLAPLVVVAAFAVAPAAQAITPHWYVNGTKATEGKQIQVVTFGGAKDLSQVSAVGEIHCKGVGGGFIENPAGKGAGVGKTQASEFYSCVAPQCEAAIKEKFGVAGQGEVQIENLPLPTGKNGSEGWENKLFVGGAPESVREAIGVPWKEFPAGGQAGHESPAGMIRATIICSIPALGHAHAVEAIFEGQLEPEIGEAASENLNGLSALHPSSAKFAAASTGALHSEVGGEGVNTGTTKYLGYVAQETVSVKE